MDAVETESSPASPDRRRYGRLRDDVPGRGTGLGGPPDSGHTVCAAGFAERLQERLRSVRATARAGGGATRIHRPQAAGESRFFGTAMPSVLALIITG